jgi:hypothetical protein
MIPALRSWTRDEMMKRVAFFKDQGSKTGLPDSGLPECERELINVIGFQPPDNEGDVVSPVGAAAARLSAIAISEGFNRGFARCRPGRGPLMHNHDTNETFMPITGRWRCAWNEGPEYECVDVGPVRRRFVSAGRSSALHERDRRRAGHRASASVCRGRKRPSGGVYAGRERDHALRR